MNSFRGKFLVVRMSSIGDIILTTPIVRSLKKKFFYSEIHFLTKKKYLPLIEKNSYISKVYSFDVSIKEVISDLRNEKYDFIIDLHKNWRSLYLRLFLSRPVLSFKKLNVNKFLYVLTKHNFMPNEHLVDRMFLGLRKLKLYYDGEGLDYFFSSDILQLPLKIKKFIDEHKLVYAFCIGGTYYTKRCPNHKVIEIINMLGKPVLVLGGKQDENNASEILAYLTVPAISCCGITSIDQSAQIINISKLVISNDTGMMHIAAAQRKPIISLWGNTVPEFGMYPLLPNSFEPKPLIAQVKGLPCRPCSKLGYHHCPKKHFKCMNDIDLSEIKKYFERYFQTEIN